jgi:hypothetical protein
MPARTGKLLRLSRSISAHAGCSGSPPRRLMRVAAAATVSIPSSRRSSPSKDARTLAAKQLRAARGLLHWNMRDYLVDVDEANLRHTASDGMETGRDLARRYLVDAVRLFAGVAFARDSEATLHSRVLAARAILTVAGIAPQAAPV